MGARVDVSELKAFRDKLNNVSLENVERSLCQQLANRVIRGAVQRTPVDTGTLKGNYRMSALYKTGNGYTVTVYNPIKYAPYVEYGHRTRGGGGWVEGKYMLTKATEDVDKKAQKIIEKAVSNEIARLLQ